MNKLIVGILAIEGASAVALTKDTDWILRDLDEKFGTLTWQPEPDKEHFDINSILASFYERIGDKFGTKQYGSFGSQPRSPYGDVDDSKVQFNYSGGYDGGDYASQFDSRTSTPLAGSSTSDGADAADFVPWFPDVNYPDPKPYSYQPHQTI